MQVNLKDAQNAISDGRLIFALFDYQKINSQQNIFGFSLDGHQVWQIEEADKLHALNVFTSVYFIDNDLYAYCRNGVEMKLDKNTGKALSKELIR